VGDVNSNIIPQTSVKGFNQEKLDSAWKDA